MLGALVILGIILLFVTLPLYLIDFNIRQVVSAQVFLGLYILVIQPILIYFKSRKAFNSKNRFTERIEWIFDHEWISMKGESFESKMTWDKLCKVVENKEVFLIFQSKLAAFIITKREMTQEQINGIRSIIQGKLDLKHRLLHG